MPIVNSVDGLHNEFVKRITILDHRRTFPFDIHVDGIVGGQ